MRAIPERLRDFIYRRFTSRHCLYLYFSLKGARKSDKPRKAWTKVLGVHMNDLHIRLTLWIVVNGGYWVMIISIRVTETVKIFTEEHGIN